MLSANERNRAKMPGRRRIRLASSRRVRSRTWWSRFSMPQCARTARPKGALPVAVAQANVFLAVQGVGGEQRAAQAQLLDQRLRRRDLVALGDLLVGQDERRLAGESAEHLRRGQVVEMVEAAAQRLA